MNDFRPSNLGFFPAAFLTVEQTGMTGHIFSAGEHPAPKLNQVLITCSLESP